MTFSDKKVEKGSWTGVSRTLPKLARPSAPGPGQWLMDPALRLPCPRLYPELAEVLREGTSNPSPRVGAQEVVSHLDLRTVDLFPMFEHQKE